MRQIRVMLGLRKRTTCTQKLKKLETITVPRLYIFEKPMFVLKILTSIKLIFQITAQIRDK